MRRFRGFVSIATIAALLTLYVTPFAGHAAAFSGDGAGTPSDPYKITSCAELQEVGSGLAASYIQEGDINCGNASLTPIGDSSTPFSGSYDGQGYQISNFDVDSPSDSYVGLFGSTDHATIIDVHLNNATVSGDGYVGAVVGYAGESTLNYLSVDASSVTGQDSNVGGVVGQLGGSTLTRSSVTATSVTGNQNNVGGVVGSLIGPASIDLSYSNGVSMNASGATYAGGVIGDIGAGPGQAHYLYSNVSGVSGVVGHVTTGFGASASSYVDVHGTGSTYKGTSSVSPFDAWDFDTDWYVRPNDFPGLRPRTMPVMLCDAPGSTNTSITASCTTAPALDGGTHWEIKYGYDDDTDRTSVANQSGDSFSSTISNLIPGTDYQVQFRYVDAIGTGPWGSQTITTTGSSDSDGDNYTNEQESKVPNSGDADNDGVKDYTQPNVTSFWNASTNNYVTLKTTCTDNFNTQLGLESDAHPDALYNYPSGLVGFVIRGCTPGATVPVTLYFYGSYGDPSKLIARKVKNGVYTTVPNVTFTNVTIGGQAALKMSYNITDGSSLDDDGIADGNIVDPIGFTTALSTTANSGTLTNSGLNMLLPAMLSAVIVVVAIVTRLYRNSHDTPAAV